MTDFEDRSAAVTETDIEVDRDVVIVDSAKKVRQERNPWAVLPILLGVLFLLLNLLVFRQVPAAFTTMNKEGAIALMMLLSSLVVCVVLIVYGLVVRRTGDAVPGESRSRFWLSVGVPLLLGLLAPLLTVWGLSNYLKADRVYLETSGKPCIEVYEKAANIAKDNPRFRMPAADRDEARCNINATLGR
ncbi:MAG: hypothetical protein FGM52_06455 [Mycobacterium sp.]|nr:hypothetical protein [Mycobacterium sp.]